MAGGFGLRAVGYCRRGLTRSGSHPRLNCGCIEGIGVKRYVISERAVEHRATRSVCLSTKRFEQSTTGDPCPSHRQLTSLFKADRRPGQPCGRPDALGRLEVLRTCKTSRGLSICCWLSPASYSPP